MRLLAKATNERPESAADVLAALEAIDLLAAGDEVVTVDEPMPWTAWLGVCSWAGSGRWGS